MPARQHRFLSIFLPYFAVETAMRAAPALRARPLALTTIQGGRALVVAADAMAARSGVAPNLPLADARALCPALLAREHDAAATARALDRLAETMRAYAPGVALDAPLGPGDAAILLDISGCAHLFGGETTMLARLGGELGEARWTHRLAIADGAGAAWAWARFRPAGAPPLLPPGDTGAVLDLPVAALRVPPDMAGTLQRLGLRRIADVAAIPTAALAARFGPLPRRRLDAVLSRGEAPLAPHRAAPPPVVHRAFAEPATNPEALRVAFADLLETLCAELAERGIGARRLVLALERSNGTIDRYAIGTAAPTRDPVHLARLFAPRLDTLDPGEGAEALVLAAAACEPLAPAQIGASGRGDGDGAAPTALIDRLTGRLGAAAVHWLAPRQAALPEAQQRRLAASEAPAPDWSSWPREAWTVSPPLRLAAVPERLEAVETDARGRPVGLHRHGTTTPLVRMHGPDRRLGAWWRGEAAARDYWFVRDAAGTTLAIFRDLADGAWRAHGPGGLDPQPSGPCAS